MLLFDNENGKHCLIKNLERLVPKEGEKLKFRNYEKMHYVPFAIYADFECNLKPMKNNIGEKTIQFQKHEPSGYSYSVKCFDNTLFPLKLVEYTKKSQDENISLKFGKRG